MPLWWSLNAGESGEWPVADHMNNLFTPRDQYRYRKAKRKSRRLAGPYTMNKTMDRGDYQWINTAFCIQGYSNEECCHKCKWRKNGNMSYADFFESAIHRLARRTTIDFLRETISLNPLCLSRAWCLEMLRTDLMHNTFQGNAARLVATTLVELCVEGHWGRQGFANTRWQPWGRPLGTIQLCWQPCAWHSQKRKFVGARAHRHLITILWIQ